MNPIISSLLDGFKKVPVSAIPSMLDCILESTDLSPSSLFSSLLSSFSDLLKDFVKDQKLDSVHCQYVTSIVAAMCHLLRIIGTHPDTMPSFLLKCFIPMTEKAHIFEPEILDQIAGLLFEVVDASNAWGILETNLVPFLLRSVGLSMGMVCSGESAVFEWSQSSVWGLLELEKQSNLFLSSPFPLCVSCHILASILEKVLQSSEGASKTQSVVENGCARKLTCNLLWDLCLTSEHMLSCSSEHRTCAIGFFLPVLFKAFVSRSSFEILVHGKTYILSRNLFFRKIWESCRSLFSVGAVERRDAYSVLSLYLSALSLRGETEECGNVDNSVEIEEFDVTTVREFWEEIKRGLIDEESLIRKQSVYIMKAVLQISSGDVCNGVSEKKSCEKNSVSHAVTKREKWAEKEAKSLGLEKLCNLVDAPSNSQQQWEAFFLLYEMLEEYGTHLVEAAWNHQVTLLLQCYASHDNITSSNYQGQCQIDIKISSELFSWLTILWQLGFRHENPQVRCLIMRSFLGIEWKQYKGFAKSVPESFVLGPLIDALNDPVHHKDFGVKGVYTSTIIEDAALFLHHYASHLNARNGIAFLHNLATTAKHKSFGRAGLMSLAVCIASAASGLGTNDAGGAMWNGNAFSDEMHAESSLEEKYDDDKRDLLDVFRFVIESSKQHFNPKYRLQVCEKVLEAVASLIKTTDVTLDGLLFFISPLPREFTDYGGLLRARAQNWLLGYNGKLNRDSYCITEAMLLKSLLKFPERFTSCENVVGASVTFDDEDLASWEFGAKRWARVLFLVIKGEDQLEPVFEFIQSSGSNISNLYKCMSQSPLKFLVLTMSLIGEIQIIQERVTDCDRRIRSKSEVSFLETAELLSVADLPIISNKLSVLVLSIQEELISFAKKSCSIFWSRTVKDTTIPSSIRGKLGGPSQRHLPSSVTSDVLQAMTSVQAVAFVSSWSTKERGDGCLNSASTFLWEFFWNTISSPNCDSETGAELCLAAYEALTVVLRALASTWSPLALNVTGGKDKSSPPVVEGEPLLDFLVLSFLQNINNLLAVNVLARTRRAVLLNWKWLCLESLLSIPFSAPRYGIISGDDDFFFSDVAIRCIFNDLVESLENAGENSVLPMLRSVRLTLDLFAAGMLGSLVSSCNGIDFQMMWHLVHSAWILHASSNKRRVACIAVLLSAVLHTSAFTDESMHFTDGAPGPLKWFIENVIEEGTKSPRTIRLVALHLTGLWLSFPKMIKYYIKELKLLTLYGSVAFDEDFESELVENHEAKTEVSFLAKSPDPELTEAFINTELYARVSVAVLFYKLADLADLVGSVNENEDCLAALESGKLFLLELLYLVVNDKDLAKELYKKYSGIHRRKIRAWQMICVMSRFITNDIVGQVTQSLHTCLYRNNVPAVRQYLETFAINIYLKFPSLIQEQLVPILQDYDMKPQALSSYVFIAANIILHASKAVQPRHLNELLPAIIPLLTSHHHSLRGFTQLLVNQVFIQHFPLLDSGTSEAMTLEKRCLQDLKSYLAKNPDCKRLRTSMEGYLDAYDPTISSTPAGIFVNRVEDIEFECVPTCLMEEVLNFLNGVREKLRCSMAQDAVTIKNESLGDAADYDSNKVLSVSQQSRETSSLDFQKKLTLYKHDQENSNSYTSFVSNGTYKELSDVEKEDGLLDQSLQSRNLIVQRMRASRQQFVLVASLLDRIPNLAGLTRTCEVFKASGLAIADTSILRDKQFQLISVTAEKWVPIIEVPVNSIKLFLEKKKREGFSILGLEQTANSVPLDQYIFPKKTVLVLGREKEGIPVDIIHVLDACVEIPQLGVVRSLNVHVSGAIALWEYTRQQRSL